MIKQGINKIDGIKQTINDVEAFIEKGQVYLKLDMTFEDSKSIRNVRLPKIEIPIDSNIIVSALGNYDDCDPFQYDPTWTVDFGLGNLKLHKDKDGHCWYETFQMKTQEMTLSEIEKKLGHPVKIIAEKKSETKKKRVK